MHTMQKSYRGLSLLMDLNWDRFLFIGGIAMALGAGAWVGTF